MSLVENIKGLEEHILSVTGTMRPKAERSDLGVAAREARNAYLATKPRVHKEAATNSAFEGMEEEGQVAFHTHMPEFPLIAQLLQHSQVIVDIQPLTPSRFANHYGVTSSQMAQLAREGWVVPNLANYKKHAPSFDFYLDPDYQHLEELFEFEKTGAQVNYLLQQTFMPASAESFKDKARPYVEKQLSRLLEKDRVFLTGYGSASDSAIVLVQHLAYLNSFTQFEDYANQHLVKFQQQNLSPSLIFDNALQLMSTSRSNVHILSGAFGGHLEPDRRFVPFWQYPAIGLAKLEKLELLAQLEYHLANQGISILELKDLPPRPPNPPSDDEWKGLISGLQKVRADKGVREAKIAARAAMSSVFVDPERAAYDRAESFNYIREVAQNSRKWARLGDIWTIGFPALGATLGAVLGSSVGNTGLGVTVGTSVATVVSHYFFAHRPKVPGEWLANTFARDGVTVHENLNVLGMTIKDS